MRNRMTRTRAAIGAAAGLLLATTAAADGQARFDLQAAIRAAAPGDTIHVPAGVYPAPIIVDRTVTLVGGEGAIIDGGGKGDLLQVTAPDVTIRGLHLRGSGDSLDRENAGIVVAAPRALIESNEIVDALLGIVVRSADESVLRRNRIQGKPLDAGRRGDGIRLWNSNNCRIESNEIVDVRDVVIWYSKGTHIVGNDVSGSRYGLHFMYASGSVLENNRLVDNSVGVFLMYSADILLRGNLLARNRGPSGYGVGLKDMDAVTIVDNAIVANRVGIYFDNSPQRVDSFGEVAGNTLAFNDVGLAFQPAVKRNRIHDNTFNENIEQVAIVGSGDFQGNDFTVAGRGNYWSDYAGFDSNGDGLGDVEYRSISLFENLMDREPKMRLFLYSPAQQAIEFAGRAFPIMRPEPKIRDAAPLMQPVERPVLAHQAAAAWPIAAGSGALLALSSLLMGGLRRVGFRRVGSAEPATPAVSNPPPEQIATPAPQNMATPAAEPVLSIRDLRKTFGRYTAVDGLNLSLAPGRATALWGTNGAGKTTIIKCILGLHRYRGEIRVGDSDARRAGRDARRLIGYVSQELAFYDDLTVLDTVRHFAALKRVDRGRCPEVLAQVNLTEHASKQVAQLSGGMKQRLALAVALLADPPVLLLDEPTSNLDAVSRRAFFELLRTLKAAGKAILFTTHRADEVTILADRVVILERGRVLREIAPAEMSADCRMRLVVTPESRAAAQESLARAGFDASQNCTAVLVRTSAARNAAPLLHLAQAGIPVESIEIESGEPND
ncbi:MAG: hypothetical protein AMXMBFR47_03820 [Planctomycetota bacterium]